MAYLRESEDGQQDLAAYLMGTGAGGVEIVPASGCQARFTRHNETNPQNTPVTLDGRNLADVTSDEIEQAIAAFLRQLRLSSGRYEDAWDLESAIKAEWLKALEAKKGQAPGNIGFGYRTAPEGLGGWGLTFTQGHGHTDTQECHADDDAENSGGDVVVAGDDAGYDAGNTQY